MTLVNYPLLAPEVVYCACSFYLKCISR